MSIISRFLEGVTEDWIVNFILDKVLKDGKGIDIYVTFKQVGRFIININTTTKDRPLSEEGVDIFFTVKSVFLRVNIKKDGSYEVSN